MSVNFAALVPHPPLAIPNLQHQEQNKVEQTIVALQELNQKITQANLDTLIVLTPHGQGEEQAFAINQSEELTPNLVNFGDLTKYPVLKNDVGLAYQIR
jgi:aromatic ring-opening dioxygenase LigB subunit